MSTARRALKLTAKAGMGNHRGSLTVGSCRCCYPTAWGQKRRRRKARRRFEKDLIKVESPGLTA